MSTERPYIEGAHTTYVPIEGRNGWSQDHTSILALLQADAAQSLAIGACTVEINPKTGRLHLVVPAGEVVNASMPRVGSFTEDTLEIRPGDGERRKELNIDLTQFPERIITLVVATANKMSESVWVVLHRLELESGN